MAFGRLTTKWRIFKRNLNFSVTKNVVIARVARKLHNFVIDNDGEDSESAPVATNLTANEETAFAPSERGFFTVSTVADEEDSVVEPPDRGLRRQMILDKIIEKQIERPIHNLRRNGEEIDI